jgi:quinol monooxygenase YgiN
MAGLVLLARFVAREGAEERLRAELRGMVGPSSAERGCLRYEALLDAERPSTVIMWQHWADRAAFDAHVGSRHFKRAAPVLAELIAEPVEVRELLESPENPVASISSAELAAMAGAAAGL